MKTDRDQLITARKAAGMTQRDLALAMGVSQPFVAQFEAGRKPWPAERVAQAYRAIDEWCPEVEHTPDERAAYLAQFREIIDRNNREGWPGITVPL